MVVVDEDRLRKLTLMDLEPDLFTTNVEGWIHIKSIKDLRLYDVEDENKI